MLSAVQDSFEKLRQLAETLVPLSPVTHDGTRTNLNELAAQSIRRAQPFAQQAGLVFSIEVPTDPIFIQTEAALASQVLDGLISNAVKFSAGGGQITIRIEKTPERLAQVIVRSPGAVLDADESAKIFNEGYKPSSDKLQRFGGLGVRLSLIKDILTRQGGKIWVENQPGKAVIFFVSMPLPH